MSFEATHEIVEIKRRTTKNGGAMWACICADNTKVNFFPNSDPAKSGLQLFLNAGYKECLAMAVDDVLSWRKHPIKVLLAKDREYYDVRAVDERPADAVADVPYKPDLAWFRKKAIAEARLLLSHGTVFFDTETTGTDHLAEIISLSFLIHGDKPDSCSILIKPNDLDAVAGTTHVHGITADMLADKHTFAELHTRLFVRFDGEMWCAYNIAFDARMLDQACMACGGPAFVPAGVHDAMLMWSQFTGLWDAEGQRWKQIKLEEACKEAGIVLDNAHDAEADMLALYELVKVIGH